MVPTGSRSSAETPRCSGPSIIDNVDTSALLAFFSQYGCRRFGSLTHVLCFVALGPPRSRWKTRRQPSCSQAPRIQSKLQLESRRISQTLPRCHHSKLQDITLRPTLQTLALHSDEQWYEKDSQTSKERDNVPFTDAQHLTTLGKKPAANGC